MQNPGDERNWREEVNLFLRGLGVTAVAAVLGLSVAAKAQTNLNAPDLVFPNKASELSVFSPLAMGIWKPEGNGPFPAVIIVHSCGGLRSHIGYWRKEAIKRGYVVLVMDSFTSRGSPSCQPMAPVTMDRGVKDIFDATAHLGTLPFVDKSRIATVGLSWGAMAGMLSGSAQYGAEAAPGKSPPGAIASLYPSCQIPPFGTFPGNEYLRQDLSTPTLVLMGGQDTESLAEVCLSRLQKLKERSAPVEWHVFKDATHCWDCSDLHNHRRSPPWAEGRTVVFLYDSAVTAQSADLVFDFFGRRLPATAKN
jgi:dienelactone hydrolase